MTFGAKYLNAVPTYTYIVPVSEHKIKMVTLLLLNF